MRAAHTRARDQKQRLRWTGWTAASYALDTLFLGLFWTTGTVAGHVPLAYGLAGAATCAAVVAVIATGRNLQLRDPSMGLPQIGIAVLLQFTVVGMAPQLAFPFLANVFTVLAFGMAWTPVRQAVAVWTFGAAALGVLFYAVGERLSLPVSTPAERVLVWSYFSLILGRCVLLSVQANELRRRLQEGRRRLADSLEQVQQLASRDELTRVLNRRSLLERLEQERGRAGRGKDAVSVALLDLDHFKSVNDTHGHAAGDEALKTFASVVHHAMRETDIFGRYGGEEFMLILAATPPAAAVPALERIRLAVAQRDWGEIAPGMSLTVSTGIAGLREGETVPQLLGRADAALYESKRLGRNRITLDA